MNNNIDNIVGNILIKHKSNTKNFYLCQDLSFTTDRSNANKFYFLKSGDTSILNNDRININCGNKTLLINQNYGLKFMDRNNFNNNVSTFIITAGSDNILPIQYEIPLFFLTDKTNNLALKYSHIDDNGFVSIKSDNPKLVNAKFDITTDINDLQFYLEKFDEPITNIEPKQPEQPSSNFNFIKKTIEFNDNHKSILLLILLFMILFLCSMLNR